MVAFTDSRTDTSGNQRHQKTISSVSLFPDRTKERWHPCRFFLVETSQTHTRKASGPMLFETHAAGDCCVDAALANCMLEDFNILTKRRLRLPLLVELHEVLVTRRPHERDPESVDITDSKDVYEPTSATILVMTTERFRDSCDSGTRQKHGWPSTVGSAHLHTCGCFDEVPRSPRGCIDVFYAR